MLNYKIDENIEMRLVSEKYVAELVSVVNENLDYLHDWMPWATEDYNKATALEFIKLRRVLFAENRSLGLFIFLDEKLVGGIGFNNLNLNNRSTEIGYWIAKKEQGRGIVTKCCREIIKHAFDELNLNRIVIRCATENAKSQAIPERLGFTKEGVLRQSEWLHNSFVDLVVYSLLKEEWENI